MATLDTRRVVLSQTTLFNSKKPELDVVSAGSTFKRDKETNAPLDEIIGHWINVRSPKTGEIQTVKLPLEKEENVKKIKQALQEEKLVKVSFNGTLRAKFWAMVQAGQLKQGITANASDLSIVSIEDPADEFDDDFIDDVNM